MEAYQLMDSGEGKKLEQLGRYRLVRQATQALWKPSCPAWWDEVDAVHHRRENGKGHWQFFRRLPDTFPVKVGSWSFKAKLTGFGHVGFFPEQVRNWDWIQDQDLTGRSVLNLFGYTGGSTFAALRAGAEVTHVDASRSAVQWARENASLNQLEHAPVRWIVEDVNRFVQREIRRGRVYQGVILDPPTYGRGARGEVWRLEANISGLLADLRRILSDVAIVLLSAHTPGITPRCLAQVLASELDLPFSQIQQDEMIVPGSDETCCLPSGAFAGWCVPQAGRG